MCYLPLLEWVSELRELDEFRGEGILFFLSPFLSHTVVAYHIIPCLRDAGQCVGHEGDNVVRHAF